MLQMASLVSRVLATIIDVLIFSALAIFISHVFDWKDDQDTIIFYFLLCISDVYQGQSIGKRLLKIKVVNFKTGGPASAIRTIIRNLLFPLNLLPIPLAVNYILYVSYFRMMGDFLSGTCVVSTKQPIPINP